MNPQVDVTFWRFGASTELQELMSPGGLNHGELVTKSSKLRPVFFARCSDEERRLWSAYCRGTDCSVDLRCPRANGALCDERERRKTRNIYISPGRRAFAEGICFFSKDKSERSSRDFDVSRRSVAIGGGFVDVGRAREFAEEGIVAISVDYSLSNDGLSPIDGVEDACAAFRWVRGNSEKFGIDPRRVAGYGWSAGGHLVAAAATLPTVNGKTVDASDRPNALLLYSPALNMAKDSYFMQLMEGKGDPAGYSPSEFISRSLPPTLIIQGEEDTIVLAWDARAFCAAADRMGARCELHVYPGVGHLLTRNLKVQYKDFDSDPTDAAEAHQLEDAFLVSLGYIKK
jgi:acetyl esterase